MATHQKQSWGAAGQLRDLDYVNPRQKVPSSALPPEVRRKLGLDRPTARTRAASIERPQSSEAAQDGGVHQEVYTGANHAEPKVGQSGAGTNWRNPNGHAFVRRGSGIPMSERASRKAQMEGPRGRRSAVKLAEQSDSN